MKQNEKNSKKKDQELTKEELEQVNGGNKVTIQDILKSTTAILMFPGTHRNKRGTPIGCLSLLFVISSVVERSNDSYTT